MALRAVFALTLTVVALVGSAGPAPAWEPPIGVPVPTFGINNIAPPRPNPWPSPTPGFYYVDQSSPNAFDSGNPYGTPGAPRRTIPTSLPAGAVVELHGTYNTSHASPAWISVSGTPTAPVFIRGVSATARPKITEPFIIGGSYFVVENIEFHFVREPGRGLLAITWPTVQGVLRHNDIHGNLGGGGVRVGGTASEPIHHVVIWDNLIHDNGDWQATFDQDVHGIGVGAHTSHLWIVDNEISRNSGSGVQVNGGGDQASLHHVYIGRNIAHHNKQIGASSKQAVDVIFSQNRVFGHRYSDSADGAGLGHQYAPERVWYLYNHIFDCDLGISVVSDSGLGFGRDSYYIGNLIHDISGGFHPSSAWSGGVGILVVGGVNRYLINNTIYNVHHGVTGYVGGSIHLVNNIISVANPEGKQILIEGIGGSISGSTMHHNLFDGSSIRINWGGSAVHDLASLQTAFPGLAANTVVADPLFVDPANEDFRLQAASLAVDAGAVVEVYRAFFDRYGIDIAKDIAGVPRPQGAAYDLGVYETIAPLRAPGGLRVN